MHTQSLEFILILLLIIILFIIIINLLLSIPVWFCSITGQ